jgi:hypothetical protein
MFLHTIYAIFIRESSEGDRVVSRVKGHGRDDLCGFEAPADLCVALNQLIISALFDSRCPVAGESTIG